MNKKNFILASIGTVVQYYDYSVYGLLAASISKYFFPESDPTWQLFKTYLLLGVGVIAKPLGAMVLGRIGDLYGRSTTLTISLIVTSIAALIVALVPSYNEIGFLATFILLVCRMAVCSSVSSGTDGVRLYIYEQIGRKRQCFGNGLVTMASQIGAFMASFSAYIFTLELMPENAWKYAYFLGFILGIITIILRKVCKVEEDENIKDSNDNYDSYKSLSISKILKSHFPLFITCSILAGCIGGSYQFLIIFYGTYMFKVLHIVEQSEMQAYTSTAILIYMGFSVFAGAAADHFGRRIIASLGFVAYVLAMIVQIIFLQYNKFLPIIYFISAAIAPFLIMPALAFMKQSIPKAIRYRIFSMAHACGSITISSTMSPLSLFLYKYTLTSWVPFVYYIFTLCLLFIAINKLCKKYKANIY